MQLSLAFVARTYKAHDLTVECDLTALARENDEHISATRGKVWQFSEDAKTPRSDASSGRYRPRIYKLRSKLMTITEWNKS